VKSTGTTATSDRGVLLMKTTGFWQDGDRYIERNSQDIEPVVEVVRTHCRTATRSARRKCATRPRSRPAVIENYIQANGITFHEFMANPAHARRCSTIRPVGLRIWKGRV
jgi:hypothetical protein